MAQLTDQQFQWIVVALVLGAVIIACWFYYVSRKYPSPKTKKDPIQNGLIVCIYIAILYGIVVIMGFRTQEEAKGDAKWLIWIFLIVIIMYGVATFLINRPIPSWKLYNKYVLPDIKRFWNAEPYTGNAYVTGMIFHKVIDTETNPSIKKYMMDMGKNTQKIDVFYGQAKFAVIFKYLSVRDKYTGEDIMLAKPPMLTETLLHKFLGKEIVSSVTPLVDEFDTQLEGQEPQAKQTEVKV